jgi:hypothetical protein
VKNRASLTRDPTHVRGGAIFCLTPPSIHEELESSSAAPLVRSF